tara:strand:+ start:962 stop:1513 length:552 start_codon:yes stop_codon:yes gene_type:complete
MDISVSRRRLFGMAGAATVGMTMLPTVGLARNAPGEGERKLNFYHLHTGERLSATYWSGGTYEVEELDRINWLLRDFRNDQRAEIDVRLLDTLYRLSNTLEISKPLHIISAYRSPATNEMLIRKGHGVAKRSMHLSGKAIDIRVPGRRLKDVRRAALAMAAGGVGYYPSSNFLHLDTGRVRRW